MKKKLIILGVLIPIISLSWIIYINLSSRITFNIESFKKNNYKIYFSNYYYGSSVKIEDLERMQKAIKCLNSIKYFDGSNLKVGSESPDANVTILDKNNNVIDRMSFYGEIVIYHGKQYRIFFWEYFKLNNLSKSLDKK